MKDNQSHRSPRRPRGVFEYIKDVVSKVIKRKSSSSNNNKQKVETTQCHDDTSVESSYYCYSSSEEFSEALQPVQQTNDGGSGSLIKPELPLGNNNNSRSPMADLSPDLNRIIADYLSAKDAYRLSMVNQQMKSDLNFNHRELCPSLLIRKVGYQRELPRFIQMIEQKQPHHCGDDDDDDVLVAALAREKFIHSVHVHCRWYWHQRWEKDPFVELFVVERKGTTPRRSRIPGQEYNNDCFDPNQIVARCSANFLERKNKSDGNDGGEKKKDYEEESTCLAMSFKPNGDNNHHYELWFRCRRHFDDNGSRRFHRSRCQDWGAGFGEVVALEIVYE